MTVRVSLLGSYGQGPGVTCKHPMAAPGVNSGPPGVNSPDEARNSPSGAVWPVQLGEDAQEGIRGWIQGLIGGGLKAS
eukprot:2413987-Pyramimonas_sp.AAC.1